ncbi:MAG TPA: DNA primase [Coprothermobacter proteolyticus]|nr:DNA primase [Coprothermobacter proteolyticus]
MTVDEAAVYIRNNVDIVEVVSRYVSLKKVGRNYFGLCPFHSEKTPSFSVNPGKGIFKCFGCGEGGDVIKFLSKIENVSYREAVKMLATEVGISVDENSETEKILQVLEEARRLMNGVLLTRSGALALRYLSSRGVKAETIGVFGLGYDPTRDFLQKALIRKGFTADLVRKAGLTNSIGNDFFGRRIVFPIENLSRRTIGFGARTLDETNPVKYLNTGETATFKKSRVLYGINQALPSIDKTKSVILVEGYFDAVVLSQEGFSNVVAILGTTVTPEQSRLLSRKVRRATFLLDSDDAGIMAALKGCFVLLSQNIEPSVALLPEGVDPDEMALRSRNKLSEILSAPINLFKFLELCAARYFGGMRSPEFLEALSQNLRGLTTSPLLEMALNELGEKMGLETKTLQSFLSSRGAKLERSEEDIYNAVSKKKPVDVESIEEQMAKLLINTPELSTILVEDEYFYPYTPGLREVLDAIKDWDPERDTAEKYVELFPPYLRDLVEESMSENFGTYQQKEKMLKELLGRWRVKDLDNYINKLSSQLAESHDEGLLEQLQEVLSERDEISRQLQGLE